MHRGNEYIDLQAPKRLTFRNMLYQKNHLNFYITTLFPIAMAKYAKYLHFFTVLQEKKKLVRQRWQFSRVHTFNGF